jgi:hypothetical protein
MPGYSSNNYQVPAYYGEDDQTIAPKGGKSVNVPKGSRIGGTMQKSDLNTKTGKTTYGPKELMVTTPIGPKDFDQ